MNLGIDIERYGHDFGEVEFRIFIKHRVFNLKVGDHESVKVIECKN